MLPGVPALVRRDALEREDVVPGPGARPQEDLEDEGDGPVHGKDLRAAAPAGFVVPDVSHRRKQKTPHDRQEQEVQHFRGDHPGGHMVICEEYPVHPQQSGRDPLDSCKRQREHIGFEVFHGGAFQGLSQYIVLNFITNNNIFPYIILF